MRDGVRNVVLIQAALALAASAVYLYWATEFAALSALFGGGVAMLNSWLLARRLDRATAMARQDVNRGTVALYLGAVQRFVVTVAGLAVGMGILQLEPLPMVITFGVAHVAYVAAATGATGTAG